MWVEATRDERVSSSEVGGSEMWKSAQSSKAVLSSAVPGGVVRLGRGEEGLCTMSVGKSVV